MVLPLTLPLLWAGAKTSVAVLSPWLLLHLFLQGGENVSHSGSLAAAASAAAITPPNFSATSQGGGGSSSVIGLSSSANANTNENAAVTNWTMARNTLIAMEAMDKEDAEDND
jgi:hypothetical protein